MSICAVQQVREAALDAQLLVLTTEMAKEKAAQLSSSNEFDPHIFVEHLVSEDTMDAQNRSFPAAFTAVKFKFDSACPAFAVHVTCVCVCVCPSSPSTAVLNGSQPAGR